MITVIDYGMGNLRSVAKALEHVTSEQILVSADAGTIKRASKIVFPGQGAAGDCMSELQRLELCGLIMEVIQDKPFLGICMGLQVLMEHSEENDGTQGLGFFPGDCRRFADSQLDSEGNRLKIPHMGWNQVYQKQSHALWRNIPDGARFYFVHSYYVLPGDSRLVAGSTAHGVEFASVLARDNVFATQFHPEKSQRDGLQLLSNFVHWDVK